MIELREVTRENYMDALRLKVAAGQESFVATNAASLAQAAYETGMTPLIAYDGDTAVGFALYEDWAERNEWWIVRLMVDGTRQGLGIGRAIMQRLIERMATLHGCKQIYISFVPDNTVADRLYVSLGFVDTGLVEDGETVYRLDLP